MAKNGCGPGWNTDETEHVLYSERTTTISRDCGNYLLRSVVATAVGCCSPCSPSGGIWFVCTSGWCELQLPGAIRRFEVWVCSRLRCAPVSPPYFLLKKVRVVRSENLIFSSRVATSVVDSRLVTFVLLPCYLKFLYSISTSTLPCARARLQSLMGTETRASARLLSL